MTSPGCTALTSWPCSARPPAGDDSETSDIDFLVEFDKGSSLFDLMDLLEALQELLGVRVDVVATYGSKDRDDHIRREAVPLRVVPTTPGIDTVP
jgi:predicted nucleotidyltransferase